MQTLSDKAKHRLRIAANLLRQSGFRFKNGNFYDAVIDVISQMDVPERTKLKGLVDWLESYELAEVIIWDTGTLPRVRKTKTGLAENSEGSGSRRSFMYGGKKCVI